MERKLAKRTSVECIRNGTHVQVARSTYRLVKRKPSVNFEMSFCCFQIDKKQQRKVRKEKEKEKPTFKEFLFFACPSIRN